MIARRATVAAVAVAVAADVAVACAVDQVKFSLLLVTPTAL